MKPRTQTEHNHINAQEYPGTRQLCIDCGDETERCEEDSFYTDAGHGPLCANCWEFACLTEKAKRLDAVIEFAATVRRETKTEPEGGHKSPQVAAALFWHMDKLLEIAEGESDG